MPDCIGPMGPGQGLAFPPCEMENLWWGQNRGKRSFWLLDGEQTVG